MQSFSLLSSSPLSESVLEQKLLNQQRKSEQALELRALTNASSVKIIVFKNLRAASFATQEFARSTNTVGTVILHVKKLISI